MENAEHTPVEKNRSVLLDLLDFVMERKKWWLLPIVVALIIIAAFIVITNTAVLSPIIYALV